MEAEAEFQIALPEDAENLAWWQRPAPAFFQAVGFLFVGIAANRIAGGNLDGFSVFCAIPAVFFLRMAHLREQISRMDADRRYITMLAFMADAREAANARHQAVKQAEALPVPVSCERESGREDANVRENAP